MHFKQPLTACVAGALGLAFSAGAIAQQTPQDKRFYVAPMVSYGFFDSDSSGGNGSLPRLNTDNDDSIGGTLAIGKPITSWLNLELFGFYFNPDQELNGQDAGDADLYGFGLDALFFPARDTLPVVELLHERERAREGPGGARCSTPPLARGRHGASGERRGVA